MVGNEEHESCANEGRPGHGSGHHRRRRCSKTGSGYSEDMVLLASTLATSLARGKTECQLETLINVVDLMQDALIAILAQRRICERRSLEIIQDDEFII